MTLADITFYNLLSRAVEEFHPRYVKESSVTKLNIKKPNRLLECQVRVISVEHAHLGILEMDTDQGFIPITINRDFAAALISELAAFMAAQEVTPDEPPVANDG